MGINFTSEQLDVTNSLGDIKLSSSRKFPHLLYSVAGTFVANTILAPGSTDGFVQRTDTQTVITNSTINNSNYLVLPYYRISGGFGETSNLVISGGGSTILRMVKNPEDNTFLGSSILNCVVANSTISLECVNSLDRRNRFDNNVPMEGDETVTVNYRILYGRFE